MRLYQLEEALKPSQYRPLVKGWDKQRYADIFLNPKYDHDKNGYRIFIPIGPQTTAKKSPVERKIQKELVKNNFDLIDYKKGIAQKKDTKQNIKIGKLLTKLKKQDLLNKFNTDKSREAVNKDYIVVISRHPYDIGGMSTDRGWTSCMNLEDGEFKKYVPLDVKHGTVIAYVTTTDDKNLQNPTGRVMIKPFVDVLDPKIQVEFGIEDKVYGTNVPGFLNVVKLWVDEVNDQDKLDDVTLIKLHPRLFYDIEDDFGDNDSSIRTSASGGSKEERKQIQTILNKPLSIKNIKNPTEKIQMAAVTTNSQSIAYIKDPTEKVQVAAVKDVSNLIQHIKNPPPKVQMAAVKRNGRAIAYIKDPTEKVQMAAVKRDGYVIQHIKNPSSEAQIAAIEKNGYAIQYIDNPSEQIQMIAVKKDATSVQHIKNPTPKVKQYVKNLQMAKKNKKK